MTQSTSAQTIEKLNSLADLASAWTLVVAMTPNGVIGRNGDLPWRLSNDLKRFKSLTMGHCLLMGRKTFDSIGRVLPGRQTIVLTRHQDYQAAEGVTCVSGLDAVNEAVEPGRGVMVVGGAEIYQQTLPRCKHLWVTQVQAEVQGDTYFPQVDWSEWDLIQSESVPAGPKDDWPTEFQQWRRRCPA